MDPLTKKIKLHHNLNLESIHACYIGTNEQNLTMIHHLLNQPCKKTMDTQCHIGVSGYYNFDLICWRKSDRAILFDCNPNQVTFMKHTLNMIRTCPSREQFKIQMLHYFKIKKDAFLGGVGEKCNYKDAMLFCPNISEDDSYKGLFEATEEIQLVFEFKRPLSWLYTDESYLYIKNLIIQDKIAIFCEDITNTPTFNKINQLLIDNHIHVDTIYVSNLFNWLNTTHNNYYNTIKLLSNHKTYIIESDANLGLYQMIHMGNKYKY